MKFIKLLFGILLLPVCVALTLTLRSLLQTISPESGADIPVAAWALATGFLLWLLIFFALPRPVRTYVLAHELSHALWGAVMGARVVRMDVAKRSGSVTLTKTNILITLAPYFFPFYTVLVIALYYVLLPFTNVAHWHAWWLGIVGFTWSFHVSFTLSTLSHQQSDVEAHGRIFSYALIYAMNMLGLGLGVILLSPATPFMALRLAAGNFQSVFVALWHWGEDAIRWTQGLQ